MTDIVSEKKRSQMMAAVRDRNTKPELAVRSYLHSRGLRYRLHGKGLPGKPDLVFTTRKIAIFVHGCFWHQHPGCRKAKLPQTKAEFWRAKLAENVRRDAGVQLALSKAGWTPLVIWECEISERSLSVLEAAIRKE